MPPPELILYTGANTIAIEHPLPTINIINKNEVPPYQLASIINPSGKTVLVIEDDLNDRTLIEWSLTRAQASHVHVFDTAETVLKNFPIKESPPDIIISDHNLGSAGGRRNMTGAEFLIQLSYLFYP